MSPAKGAAVETLEADIERAEAAHAATLEDPNSDPAVVAAARGAVDHAHAQRSRAERLDRETAEAARTARVDEILAEFRSGRVRQRALDALAVRAEAAEALHRLHEAVSEHSAELESLHRELQRLGEGGPLPDGVETGKRASATDLLRIDGLRWIHKRGYADRLLVELVAGYLDGSLKSRVKSAAELGGTSPVGWLSGPLEASNNGHADEGSS